MMKKKRMIIIGAGISGLSAAWHLSIKHPEYDCLLLEENQAPGGCIYTKEQKGFLLEQGPRIFKTSRCLDLLSLIEEIGLSSEIIFSPAKLHSRYLWTQGSLKKLPENFFSLLFSSYFRPLLWALCKEWKQPTYVGDETIWSFGCRRFGVCVTERLLDPMVLGIYAGDYKKLSVKACFPILKEWEQKFGSLTLGLLRSSKKKVSKGLFSFHGGMNILIQRLVEKIPFSVCCEQRVLSLQKMQNGFIVMTEKGDYVADRVILAVSASKASKILYSLQPEVSYKLAKIPCQKVTIVNVVLEGDVLPVSGFGYLVPSQEGEVILGGIFDSKLFPRASSSPYTQLTFMLKGDVGDVASSLVQKALITHLGLSEKLKVLSWSITASQKIPQYLCGHQDNVQDIRQSLQEGIFLVGNYLEGVSVNDCVRVARSFSHFL